MQEPRRADLAAVGAVGAVGHQIDAEFALRGLDRRINLARRHVEAFGIKLEVMDQRFHRGLHLAALGRSDLAACQDVARLDLQLGNGLPDDRGAFAHFLHPAQIAVIAIAIHADRNLEVEFVIAFIRLAAPQVPGQARSAHHDAGKAPGLDILFRHHADVGIALLEDAVLGQQPVDIVQHARKFHRPLVNVVQQLRRQVLMHAAGPEIGGMQPRAACSLIEHHQLFALFKAPERRRQRAHVHRLRRHVQQMVQHPADFAEQHADQAGPARHDHAGQLFDGQTPGMFLVHRGHIIQPVEIGQVLQIGAAFHQLFGATVQQTDMRIAAFHNLAVQLQHKTKNSMRRRMLRPEVQVEVPDFLLARQGIVKASVHHALTSPCRRREGCIAHPPTGS